MDFEPDEGTPHKEAPLKRFNVYKHPVHGHQAIYTGWSWPAFLFDWIWAFSKGMWQAGAFILLAYLVVGIGASLFRNSECLPECSLRIVVTQYVAVVILLWLKILLGRGGNQLRAENLAIKGYKFMGSTPALSGDDAIARAANGEIDQAPIVANESPATDAPQATFATVAGSFGGRGGRMFFLLFVIAVPISLILYFRSIDRPYGNEVGWTDIQTFALAEIGNADAQYEVAVAYERGRGVPEDEAKSLEWYQRAANNGEMISMHKMAGRYWHGDGVTKDAAKAVEWYKKAAEAGWPYAQNDLGWIYVNGENGIAVNYGEALRLFRESSKYWHEQQERKEDSKCDEGCLGLGYLYAKGLGVPADASKADFYLRKGMEGENRARFFLRNADAINLVARLYAGGGVPTIINTETVYLCSNLREVCEVVSSFPVCRTLSITGCII